MRLRLSLSEVISKSTQALKALNFPPGLDIENGKNIGWLEARGLPGLANLFEEIKAPSNTPRHNPIKIGPMKNNIQFSGENRSAFYLAQSAVDFAENGKRVSINNCRFPLMIFAEMARRSHLPFGFQVKWIKDDEINKGFAISGNSEVTINSGSWTASYNLEITSVKNLIIKNRLNKISHESTPEENGINCDPYHWEAICAMAKKALVPDSQKSHISAGAGLNDSI